ncbi:putative wall-associated receptor kinase-like 16 [Forsythia ovata]|uniref:Wall-associated receptor kinase-like 16 n=1 Tax=Forsythia ovata TaxID=205694 RepID=A0ABD1PU97_9LAMI
MHLSESTLSSLRNVKKLLLVVDWAIENGTCEEARKNMSSYGCKSTNSKCYKPDNGISLGIVILVLAACLLYMELKRRKLIRMKHEFFLQNGGLLLQEKLIRRDQSPDVAKILTSAELKKATNDFHDSRIVGQGGFGTVYKGFLSDNRIVAIKKSKQVDLNQVEQFVNEVIVLSQINHMNVVRLVGCCLETQVPLLVYEFIDNGTLFEQIHNKTKAYALSWDKHLRIATEATGVLAYLHSAASPPIIHTELISISTLAKRCLYVKGEDRPTMKEVAIELEGLRPSRKHSKMRTEHGAPEMESLLREKFNARAHVMWIHSKSWCEGTGQDVTIVLTANRRIGELPFKFNLEFLEFWAKTTIEEIMNICYSISDLQPPDEDDNKENSVILRPHTVLGLFKKGKWLQFRNAS